MVPLPLAEPSEVYPVETMARLTHSQTPKEHPNNTHTQSVYNNSTSTNNNTPQNNAVHSPA